MTHDELKELQDWRRQFCKPNGEPMTPTEARAALDAASTTPRVIVEVSGGVVQAVYAGSPISADILDHDDWQDANEGDDEAKHYASLTREIRDNLTAVL